jgi:threonine dehydratase
VNDVLLVTDDDLVETMRFLFERLKVVVEPSGASALTAILTNRDRFIGRRVGVILSGGSIGTDRFLSLLSGERAR